MTVYNSDIRLVAFFWHKNHSNFYFWYGTIVICSLGTGIVAVVSFGMVAVFN